MALACTHIRFALDLQEQLAITDLPQYLSGTIYPDSRFVSRIARDLTHGQKFLQPDWWRDDDFKTGWMVHLLADKGQLNAMEQLFPSILTLDRSQGSDWWVLITAKKIIQDIQVRTYAFASK
ncbi:hypothetical protein HY933_03185 [Candidatus Falkowbacteria bacterium]|nr:hypothetical protein [Candidatus Falkowbacteria bacterium]